jgi:cobalt-zinc-cadmium efflux system protein
VNEMLLHKYNIQHATLQLECEGCVPSMLYCDISEVNHIHEKV